MTIRFPTKILAAPGTVWPYLTEPKLLKQWMRQVTNIEGTGDGLSGVGSTSRVTVQEGERKAVYHIRVVELAAPSRLAVVMSGATFRNLEYRVVYNLDDGVDHTILMYEASCEISGIAGFAMKLFGGIRARSLMKSLGRLVEADAVAP